MGRQCDIKRHDTLWKLISLVDALSRVNHEELHQSWKRTSVYLQAIHSTSHYTISLRREFGVHFSVMSTDNLHSILTYAMVYGHCLVASLSTLVLAGTPSWSGDVAVYIKDINQLSLPIPFYSVLVSISVFVALSTVLHSIKSPDNSLFSRSVLLV